MAVVNDPPCPICGEPASHECIHVQRLVNAIIYGVIEDDNES